MINNKLSTRSRILQRATLREKTEIEGWGNGVGDGRRGMRDLRRGFVERVRRDRGSVEGAADEIWYQYRCRNPLPPYIFENWPNRWKGSERQLAGVGVGIGGEVAAIRLLFHQTQPFPRVYCGRGVRTTGRGSVDRTKRSQAFSIQPSGLNPLANCISNRRTIKHTTYPS